MYAHARIDNARRADGIWMQARVKFIKSAAASMNYARAVVIDAVVEIFTFWKLSYK